MISLQVRIRNLAIWVPSLLLLCQSSGAQLLTAWINDTHSLAAEIDEPHGAIANCFDELCTKLAWCPAPVSMVHIWFSILIIHSDAILALLERCLFKVTEGSFFAFVDQTEEKGYFQCMFALSSRRFLPFSDRTEASSRWNKVVESLLAIWDKTIATCKCNVIWRTHIESGLEPALPILPENVLTSYVSQEQCTGHKRVKWITHNDFCVDCFCSNVVYP